MLESLQDINQEINPEQEVNQEANAENLKDVDIYVMPEKMIVKKEQKKSKKMIFIIIGIFLVLIIIGGVTFFVLNKKIKELPAKIISPLTENIGESPTEGANSINTEGQLGDVTAPTQEQVIPINTPTSTANLTPTTTEEIAAGLDSDKDGLTDGEEKLYKTDSLNPDMDGDGFLDGSEVINLYSPLSREGKIDISGLINVYINPVFKYSLFYPAGWIAQALDQSNATVIFTSATGEFIESLVLENPQKLAVSDWYKEQSSDINLLDIQKLKLDGQEAIEIIDKENGQKIIYCAYKDKVYGLIYNYGSQEGLNFETTFGMMINSFKF